MIKAIEIAGFRSLRDIRVELGPLNVLIGPNQSGKTNLLEALDLLKSAALGRLDAAVRHTRGGMPSLLYAGKGADRICFDVDFRSDGRSVRNPPVSFGFTLIRSSLGYAIDEEHVSGDDSQVFYKATTFGATLFDESDGTFFEVDPEEIDPSELAISISWVHRSYPTLRLVHDELSRILIYTGFDIRTRWESDHPNNAPQIRQPQFVTQSEELDAHGDNLVNVLYTLSQDQERWEDFKEMIRTGFPDFENLVFPADAGQGRIAMAWVDRRFPKKRFYADVLSAGTLCFLAWAAALAAPEAPTLIAIDEPEQHLHPELLYRLVGLMEQASAKHQIIVTTHSDALLSYLSDPTCVVLVNNGPEGTTLTRPPEADLREWLKTYSLGQLRESGHLSAFAPTES